MTNRAPSATLDTTETSLRILTLVKDLDGATLAEIAAASDLAKSTVHTHLQTLYANGYLTRDGDRYDVGYKFLNLGEYVRYRNPAHAVVEQTVDELADTTNEEVAFGVEDHGRNITVHEVYYDNQIVDRHAGSYHYMHNTASGKSMLAAFPEYRVEEILDRWGLPATTDRTITSREDLYEELETIRAQGYALNDEEFLDGLRAIGRVVKGPEGDVLGGLSVSGPAYRISTDRLVNDFRPTVLSAVEDLESNLAESPSDPPRSRTDR